MANLGKYTLVRKLAAGGMAEVFLARTDGPAGFSKTQVIKRILPHLSDNEEFVSMFLNEARLAALLNHPNIIQIFELGKEDGTYFIAMELVDGTNLRTLARAAHGKGEFLPFEVVLKIISLACEGLAYAHEFIDESGQPLELVHRDISPDNLLVSRQGAVKVADFGIAKAANLPNLTKTGILKGKINYMPPEQLRAIPLDRRADVFALGVVMHEALASTKPFSSSSDVSAMQSILNESPRRLADLRPDLSEDLQVIIDKALAKDRDQRYADCRALQADLDGFLVKRGASVRALDIANLVAKYTPLAPRTSIPPAPLVPVSGAEKAGTPPLGTLGEEVPLELSLHQSMLVQIDEASGASSSPPRTRTGPKPLPQDLAPPEPSPPPQSSAALRSWPSSLPRSAVRSLQVEAPIVELHGGRPPERSRAPARGSGWALLGILGGGFAIAVVVATQHAPPPAAPTGVVAAPTAPVAPPPVAAAPVAPAPVVPSPVVPSPVVPSPVAPPTPVVAVAPTPAATLTPVVPAPAPPKPEAVADAHRARHHRSAEPALAPVTPTIASVPTLAAQGPSPTPAPVLAATEVVIKSDDSGPSTGPKTSSTEPGTLVLRVAPWAEVEIDGTSYGVTPMAPVKLMPGTHQVRLKNSEVSADRHLKVEIKPGLPETLRVNLALPQ